MLRQVLVAAASVAYARKGGEKLNWLLPLQSEMGSKRSRSCFDKPVLSLSQCSVRTEGVLDPCRMRLASLSEVWKLLLTLRQAQCERGCAGSVQNAFGISERGVDSLVHTSTGSVRTESVLDPYRVRLASLSEVWILLFTLRQAQCERKVC